MTQTPEQTQQAIQQQAGKLLSQVAGYVGVRTMEIGLRLGLLKEMAKHSGGITAEALAKQTGLDPQYVRVWCRAAYASEVLELPDGQKYMLAPHVDKLLLDPEHPGYIPVTSAVCPASWCSRSSSMCSRRSSHQASASGGTSAALSS